MYMSDFGVGVAGMGVKLNYEIIYIRQYYDSNRYRLLCVGLLKVEV